jgi:hypothetical protein
MATKRRKLTSVSEVMSLRDQLVAELARGGSVQPGPTALLEEVAIALRTAGKLREAALEEPFTKSERSGRSYIHPGIAAADVEVRRAALLLQRVDAIAKAQPAPPEEPEDNPFAELDEIYALAPRRRGAR